MFAVAKTKTINNLKIYHHGTDENTRRNIVQLLKIVSYRERDLWRRHRKNVSWRVICI